MIESSSDFMVAKLFIYGAFSDTKIDNKSELNVTLQERNVFGDGSGTLQRRTICHRHLKVERTI